MRRVAAMVARALAVSILLTSPLGDLSFQHKKRLRFSRLAQP